MTTQDILRRLFRGTPVVTRMQGGQLKIYDVNKSQSIGTPSTYHARANWRSGRTFSNRSGYGSGFTNEEIETLRRQMYLDYELMDTDAIIHSSLDLYAEETLTKDVHTDDVLVIKSDDVKIKKVLHNLFYDVLNLEFNAFSWIRTMCKYGDAFLYLQIAEKYGVVNVMPIHPALMRREEGNTSDPNEVRFLYEGDGGFYRSTRAYFEEYEIAHFRLLSDNAFLPYGMSVIEGARKDYKSMTLAEDAALLHLIMRAPERRIFYVDVGAIAPEEVPAYMENIINETKKVPHIDQDTGQMNLRYNLQTMLEDLYIPTRGDKTGNKVDTLPGLTYEGGSELVKQLRRKMMAALKIPPAYMGYGDEGASDTKCLHPDTMIKLLNGTISSISDISRKFELKDDPNLWTYSFDIESNSVIPVKIKRAKQTRKNAELVRVWLDNDTHVDCTPDHKFILRDGTEVPANMLRTDDSLCTIHTRVKKMSFLNLISKNINFTYGGEYEQVYQPGGSKWQCAHVMVDRYFDEKMFNGERHVDFQNACDYLNAQSPNIKTTYGEFDVTTDDLEDIRNHKVVKVEILSDRIDTYDMEVDDHNHNFLLANGLVIKNSNLSSLDLRFGHSIERIQKIIISELYKIAVIHLKVQGFSGSDLLNFELKLTSPSLIFERQKLDILTAKIDLIKSIKEDNILSDQTIYQDILNMTEDEFRMERERIVESAEFKLRITQITEEGNDPKKTGKTFGTPHDIASMQVASKFDADDIKKLYTPDERENNPGRPDEYKGSFETKRDQDFGRDPMGRKENNKMAIPKESINRILALINDKQVNTKKSLTENGAIGELDMLNESNLLGD